MASDYAKSRAVFEASQKRKNAIQGQWRPKAGQYLARIMPSWAEGGPFIQNYRCHYQILPGGDDEGTALMCRKSIKEKCYGCEVTQSLWDATRDPAVPQQEVEAIKKKASRIGSKDRYIVNAVPIAVAMNGKWVAIPPEVLRWSFGIQVADQLKDIIWPPTVAEGDSEPEACPIEDPDHGYNLQVKVVDKGQGFTETLVTRVGGPVAIKNRELLKKLHNLEKWVLDQVKTYDQQRALLSPGENEAEGAPEIVGGPEFPPETEIAEEMAPVEVVDEGGPVVEEPEPPPASAKGVTSAQTRPVSAPAQNPVVRPNPKDVTAAARAKLKAQFSK